MLENDESGTEKFPTAEPSGARRRLSCIGLCIPGRKSIATTALEQPVDRKGKYGDESDAALLSPLFPLRGRGKYPRG